MSGYEPDIAKLRAALRELMDAIEYVEDKTYTRDIEPYKAEAIWDWAIETANKALRETAVPYPLFCFHPDKCRGTGRCQRDPVCND